MAEEKFEVFLHVEGAKPKVVQIGDDEALIDVLLAAGLTLKDDKGIHVFVGESDNDEDGDDEDDSEDKQEPVDPKQTAKELDLRRHRHIHLHRCLRIAVEVTFAGKTKKRKFAPAASVGRVTKWARRKFRIDAAVASEYVLQLCGTTEVPRSDVHLGELVKKTCALCFDLVKEVTPQG